MKLSDIIKKEDLFKNPEVGFRIGEYYDKITHGAIKGQTHVLIGGSGTGKTHMGVFMACSLLKQGLSVGYLTFEQSPEQIVEMVLANYHGKREGSIEEWSTVGELPLCVRRFDTGTKESIEMAVKGLSCLDAIVLDYLCPPDDCTETEASSLRIIMKDLKNWCEEHNQFFFCLMQGRQRDAVSFSTTEQIVGSRQVINPVEVAIIMNKSDEDGSLELDFIKNRYNTTQYYKIRLIGTMNYETSTFNEIGVYSAKGDLINEL